MNTAQVLLQVEFLTSLLGFKASGNRASSTSDSAEVAGLSLPGCTQQDFPGKYPPQVRPSLTYGSHKLCLLLIPWHSQDRSPDHQMPALCAARLPVRDDLCGHLCLLLQVSLEVATKACMTWLKKHGAVLVKECSPSEAAVDCKASATTLVLPAAVAVAHGDANLNIDDFLKSMS